MAEEEWRSVVGWEGFYEVSSHGRVRSLDRLVRCKPSRNKDGFQQFKGKAMKPSIRTDGYYVICLSREGEVRSRVVVHRLVAEAFVVNADNKKFVNHINGDKLDNRPENLEWVTQAENNAHAWKTGLNYARYGSRTSNAKLTEEQVREIRRRLDEGDSIKNVALAFKMSYPAIDGIKNRRNWKHID